MGSHFLPAVDENVPRGYCDCKIDDNFPLRHALLPTLVFSNLTSMLFTKLKVKGFRSYRKI